MISILSTIHSTTNQFPVFSSSGISQGPRAPQGVLGASRLGRLGHSANPGDEVFKLLVTEHMPSSSSHVPSLLSKVLNINFFLPLRHLLRWRRCMPVNKQNTLVTSTSLLYPSVPTPASLPPSLPPPLPPSLPPSIPLSPPPSPITTPSPCLPFHRRDPSSPPLAPSCWVLLSPATAPCVGARAPLPKV